MLANRIATFAAGDPAPGLHLLDAAPLVCRVRGVRARGRAGAVVYAVRKRGELLELLVGADRRRRDPGARGTGGATAEPATRGRPRSRIVGLGSRHADPELDRRARGLPRHRRPGAARRASTAAGSSCSATHELYELWERQQWATQDLDFSQDRVDWHERFSTEERYTRMYGLSAFFIGEQRVTDELGPIMRAAPTEEMRIFLSTQIADEARHVQFFNRFYDEVGVLEGADDLAARLARVQRNLNPEFAELFDGMLKSRVDRLAAEPEDTRDAGRGDHALPHGHRGGAGAHRPALHHRLQRASRGRCPGSSRGSATSPATSTATSPSAPASSWTWRPPTTRYRDAIQRTLVESLPVAEGVLRPPFAPEDDDDFELFGVSMRETQAFAAQCLTRRLKVIGLAG